MAWERSRLAICDGGEGVEHSVDQLAICDEVKEDAVEEAQKGLSSSSSSSGSSSTSSEAAETEEEEPEEEEPEEEDPEEEPVVEDEEPEEEDPEEEADEEPPLTEAQELRLRKAIKRALAEAFGSHVCSDCQERLSNIRFKI